MTFYDKTDRETLVEQIGESSVSSRVVPSLNADVIASGLQLFDAVVADVMLSSAI